jgi:hypothetical protein
MIEVTTEEMTEDTTVGMIGEMTVEATGGTA